MRTDPDRDISHEPTVTIRLGYWREAMLAVPCPVCGFAAAEPCPLPPGTMHLARLNAWTHATAPATKEA